MILDKVKNFFGGVANMIEGQDTLVNITDHPRINLPDGELTRIHTALKYYANDFGDVRFINSNGKKTRRPYYSLGVTKSASRQLASLIANEGFGVSVQSKLDEGDDTINAYIKDTFKRTNFYQNYEENLEVGIATGGFAIRPYISNDKVCISWVRADQFIPLEANTNDVKSAAIISRSTNVENKKTAYYSLLEFHEYNQNEQTETITNELYRSTSSDVIGNKVPLATLPDYVGLNETTTISGLTRPTFSYFKTPGKNNINVESPLGVGIVDNNLSIVDAINIANDQFVREVKLGKRRIAVTGELIRPAVIQKNDAPLPPAFDEDDDTFTLLERERDGQGIIKDLTTDIRTDEYSQTLQMYMHQLENSIGLSQGALSVDAAGGASSNKTATEVVSDNSKTYRTRSSYLTMAEKQIRGLVTTIIELSSIDELFDGEAPIQGGLANEQLTIAVQFNDGVFVDKDAQAQADMLAVQNQLMPKIEFMKRNYGLTDKDAQDWLNQIKGESVEPDPITGTMARQLGDEGA